MALAQDKKFTIGYWIVTLLFALPMLGAGLSTVMKAPEMAQNYTALEYPLYMMSIVGTAKILGVLAILQPKFKRIKEWAYAGFVINMIGAALSHGLHGDPVGQIVPPLVLLGIVIASNILWHQKLTRQAAI